MLVVGHETGLPATVSNAAEVEIDLKRLLHRLQAALAHSSHASIVEDEVLRRWTYVEHARNLLRDLHTKLTSEDDVRRLSTYEDRLNFILQLMLAGEGHRPSLYTMTQDVQPQVTLENEGAQEARLRRQALSAEQQHARTALLGQTKEIASSKREASSKSLLLGSDTDIRRRLGLSTGKNKAGEAGTDANEQLEQDRKQRDSLASDVLSLITTLKENSINVQKSLQSDSVRLENVDNLLSKNLTNVKKEITRVDSLFRSTSASCRANCALVTTVLAIWIAVYLVMKITPRPS